MRANQQESFFDGVPEIQDYRLENATEDIPLTRVSTGSSLRSALSFSSTTSTKTFLPHGGGYGGSLEHLCDLIDAYPSLRDAEIVSSECHTQRIRIVLNLTVHRFLILELRRGEKKPIWIRLDRTRTKTVSDLDFVRAAGRIQANDTVSWDAEPCLPTDEP